MCWLLPLAPILMSPTTLIKINYSNPSGQIKMLHWNTSSLIQKHKMMCTCSASQIVLLLLYIFVYNIYMYIILYIIVLVYHLYNSCLRDITFLLLSSQILSDLLERLELPMVMWKPVIFKICYHFISAFSLILTFMCCLQDWLLWLCLKSLDR